MRPCDDDNKVTPENALKFWQQMFASRNDEVYKHVWETIRSDISGLETENDNEEALIKWTLEEFDDCGVFKARVEQEGESYFFTSYIDVPFSTNFVLGYLQGDHCWCGHCDLCGWSKGSDSSECRSANCVNRESK